MAWKARMKEQGDALNVRPFPGDDGEMRPVLSRNAAKDVMGDSFCTMYREKSWGEDGIPSTVEIPGGHSPAS
jgi:hypothetical protein